VSSVDLARRLRQLRRDHWAGRPLTQLQLAEAFGEDRPLSESLISSWESLRAPTTPPDNRLLQYATLFCSERSIAGAHPRLLAEHQLTAEERTVRDELLQELHSLRDRPGSTLDEVQKVPLAGPRDTIGGGSWFFADRAPVTIVCGRLPENMRAAMPYTDPDDPDYVRLYTFADLDSLLELHGHIRAVNPGSLVHVRAADELSSDDLTTHLVLLGGVDWNRITAELVRRLRLPVRQQARRVGESYDSCFESGDGADKPQYRPVLEKDGDTVTLKEDIGHFFRAPSPFNWRRTATICNGMFARGTYGAVRALTDARFRDRNEEYVAQRFGGDTFSVLARVPVVNRETVTPDWTVEHNRLHEWPGGSS
jgi:hypothetical protein